jgi:hypothetical protein
MTLQLADDGAQSIAPARKWARTVHHGGRCYVATEAMAAIFESHATDAIERGETELVPLLHRGGVDLLLIGPQTSFAVVSIELGLTGGRARRSAPPRAALIDPVSPLTAS